MKKVIWFLYVVTIISSCESGKSLETSKNETIDKEKKSAIVEQKEESKSGECDKQLLLGNWVLTDEGESKITIDEVNIRHFYGGNPMDTLTYFTQQQGNKCVLVMINSRLGDSLFCEIDHVDKQYLSLIQSDRGNYFTYKKIPN